MLRAVDHLVLAVGDLQVARERLSALGFTVAPDARHPFGTENACVFMRDGTYLEPLAIGSEAESARSAREGNVFTARDRAFRFRHGDEGFEAFVLQSDDARADDAAFRQAGWSAGEILEFSRPFVAPDGSAAVASFRLAFAGDLRSPDFYVFACERINMPTVDRAALTAHQNGATGLAEIVLCERDPAAFGEFLSDLAGAEVIENADGLQLALANARLSVVTPDAFAARFGKGHCTHGRGLRGRAVVFSVASLEAAAALFRRNSVIHEMIGARLVVPHRPGQGVFFSFEEKA